MENEMKKCDKCGGEMKKVDENTSKCDKCGEVENSTDKKEEKVV